MLDGSIEKVFIASGSSLSDEIKSEIRKISGAGIKETTIYLDGAIFEELIEAGYVSEELKDTFENEDFDSMTLEL